MLVASPLSCCPKQTLGLRHSINRQRGPAVLFDHLIVATPALRLMVRFLRRRGRGQGKALTFGGRCRNLRCTEPRAKSSGYGDLIELVAAALSESKGRMCGGSAASWAFAGGSVCSLAILLAR